MIKAKKVLLLALSFALVAAISIAGTVAYLTSEDSDVNVMTLGNVKIEQHEYERAVDENGDYKTDDKAYILTEFTQAKPLYPAVGTTKWDENVVDFDQVGEKHYNTNMNVFDEASFKNAQDKFVFVENTGKTDAYVRTIVAFEVGAADADLIGYSYHGAWTVTEVGTAVIKENNYFVVELVFPTIVEPGYFTPCSLAQVYLSKDATNEDCEALDGNGNGTYDILVLSQAVQSEGFANAKTALDTAFGKSSEKAAVWFGGVAMPSLVTSVDELQAAIDAAVDGDIIVLGDDIEGDVTVTQKAGVKFTINGNGKTIDGSIIVNGKSARYETAGVTIENVNFSAETLSTDAFVNLGKSGDSNTRYTNNVTVSNCTFAYDGTGDKVAIKSYTGGDWNLTVEGCTVAANMHSMLQVTNVEKGLTITDCKVNSKNGINLNNTPYLNMSGCEFDTKGYCVRFGVNGSTNSGNFTIADSTLKSANDDGDAVIIFRGDMSGATLNLEGTTLTGTPDITGK